ncbi:hypothetical protein GH741_08840 [Aquibacillus halophilus]|uniref:Alpha fucosidase A-like C-terminal domain-containing protein n=1 Tax=Aquibacillus halophilus TaxID=930132 RepID=A0A6A8DNG5_9BACI|nr:hypothetical protein [Aquibacillus halophilus]
MWILTVVFHDYFRVLYSGGIELLPAFPNELDFGSISGLLARGQIEVNQLNWDYKVKINQV